MNDSLEIVHKLEATWDFDSGFFGKLRRGQFDATALNAVYETLDSLDFSTNAELPRRAVSLLWYMPLFMTWQRERIAESGFDLHQFEQAVNRIQGSIERILGIP